jgi:hypothetical protein
MGVAAADAVLAEPVPFAFVADTRNLYEVPFVSPVTVVNSAVEVPSLNVDHELYPGPGAYSIT